MASIRFRLLARRDGAGLLRFVHLLAAVGVEQGGGDGGRAYRAGDDRLAGVVDALGHARLIGVRRGERQEARSGIRLSPARAAVSRRKVPKRWPGSTRAGAGAR